MLVAAGLRGRRRDGACKAWIVTSSVVLKPRLPSTDPARRFIASSALTMARLQDAAGGCPRESDRRPRHRKPW